MEHVPTVSTLDYVPTHVRDLLSAYSVIINFKVQKHLRWPIFPFSDFEVVTMTEDMQYSRRYHQINTKP